MDDEEDQNEEQARMMYSEIMRQLLESDRFVRFFQVNYDLHKLVDEETKTMEFRLIEVPPEIAQQRLEQLVTGHAKEHSFDIVGATMDDLNKIKNILGGKDDS